MPDTTGALRRRRMTTAWPLCALLLSYLQPTEAALPTRFHQDQSTPPLTGLVGTSMTDVVWSGRYLWVATERGLARWDPAVGNGLSPDDWITYT